MNSAKRTVGHRCAAEIGYFPSFTITRSAPPSSSLPSSFSSRDIRCPLLSRSESRSSALSLLAKRRVISNRSLNLTLRNDLTRDGDRRRCPNGGECGSWPQRRGARHGLLLHDSGAPRHLDEGRLDGNAPAAGTLQISIGLRNYRVSQS